MLNNLRIYCQAAIAAYNACCYADTIPSRFETQPVWRIGAEVSPAFVPGTSDFIKGQNTKRQKINSSLSADVKADFSFSPETREGMLYPGTYQGIGVAANTFSSSSLTGNPVSIYVYQGAPILQFNNRLSLGYEWKFGAAMGWKHDFAEEDFYKGVISTAVTAHMSLGFSLYYRLSENWQMSASVEATHFSNGNTSLPNRGLNTIGASVGMAYVINPQTENRQPAKELTEDADRGRWIYDIVAYGAWRKRIIMANGSQELCPGHFGVLGLQFSPMRKLNRWVSAGPALDMQWDEGAGLEHYRVDGTEGDNIRFTRPPFGKQVSLGLSAHAELTMPIFTVNAGLGYSLLCPQGDKAFYQSLTLKTFISRHTFLNVGYRLGNFREPQNLMLGIGVRL